MTSVESKRVRDWTAIAEEAMRIGYFQVPKHDGDPRVQALDRRLARFNQLYRRPFSFSDAPEGIAVGDYISPH